MAINKKCVLFYTALAVFSIFLACLSTNYDFDLFARLIVGERFIEQGILPFKDFLSYTPTHPWYDHEWGSGVVFYFLIKHLGPFGFVAFQAAVMFFTSVFVVKTQRLQKHALPSSLIFMGIFLALFLKLNSSLVRCQLFSFLFFSIFLYILESTRRGKHKNLIWIFPPLVILWNNVHGVVVSGLGLIAMYFAGAVIERKPWKKYLAVLITSGLALVINPYGPKYLNFLFSAATKHRKYIVEWWPFFAYRHILYYILPSLFGIFGFLSAIRTKKIDVTKIIVLAVTLYCGLAHVKLLSITVIAAAALCYNDMAVFFLRFKRGLKKFEKSLYPAIFVLALMIPLFSPTAARCDEEKFPLYEMEFLKINNIKGNLVTPFALGSYATYKLYPDILIFMDGRYEEVYNDEEFKVLKQYDLVDKNWKDIFTKYPTDILMPYKESGTYTILKQEPDWVHIFDGRICGIFVKKGKEKFSYFEPEYDMNYYRKTMFKHGDFTND